MSSWASTKLSRVCTSAGLHQALSSAQPADCRPKRKTCVQRKRAAPPPYCWCCRQYRQLGLRKSGVCCKRGQRRLATCFRLRHPRDLACDPETDDLQHHVCGRLHRLALPCAMFSLSARVSVHDRRQHGPSAEDDRLCNCRVARIRPMHALLMERVFWSRQAQSSASAAT